MNRGTEERPGLVDKLREHWLIGEGFKAWFGLTEREQLAVMLVTALFLLGVLVRCWRVWVN